VIKYFVGFGKYEGTIYGARMTDQGNVLYYVKFEDGDAEEFNIDEVRQLIHWYNDKDSFEQYYEQLG
jgi:hypothetical protein